MKNLKLYIALIAGTVLSLSSCKNDLDVLAPGEESISVYGILNPNEPVQNIRINKVYITDGDALTAGQDPNQINYGAGELKVTLQRFMSGSTTPTLTTIGNSSKTEIVLTETVITTASGIFSNQQRIWQTTDRLFKSGEYKLKVTNLLTAKEYTAQTLSIDSVKPAGLQQPMPFLYNPTFFPMHGGYPSQPTTLDYPKYVDYKTLTTTYKIKFRSVANAKLYNVTLRFHYIDSLIGGTSFANYVDITYPTLKSPDLAGGVEMEISFKGSDFFSSLGQLMSEKPSIPSLKNRRAYYLEYIIDAGSDDLYNFLQVNAPSNSIAQDKPYFTNVKGAVGIFACKSKSFVTKDMWSEFIDKIACHPNTNPYFFCNSSGVTSGVCP